MPASDDIETVAAAAVLRAVRPLLGARRLLVASDFDGTLANLVADPWSARAIPSARRALRRLAGTAGVHVAIISGRTVADLVARLGVGGVSYRGDHGAERAEAPRGFRPASLPIVRAAVAPEVEAAAHRLKAAVPAAVDEPWLVLEDKGPALTFHFRSAPDVDEARRRVTAAADDADPAHLLRRSGSRRALELRPPDAATKADALAELVVAFEADAALMLGDDRNDAAAFDVLRELRAAGRIDGLAIAVAGHADVTRDVAPHADVVLASPRETARFLGALASELADRRRP